MSLLSPHERIEALLLPKKDSLDTGCLVCTRAARESARGRARRKGIFRGPALLPSTFHAADVFSFSLGFFSFLLGKCGPRTLPCQGGLGRSKERQARTWERRAAGASEGECQLQRV